MPAPLALGLFAKGAGGKMAAAGAGSKIMPSILGRNAAAGAMGGGEGSEGGMGDVVSSAVSAFEGMESGTASGSGMHSPNEWSTR